VQIQAVLFKEDKFEISDREVEYAFEWYGQLVSGAVFKDKKLLGELRSQGGVVLSLDGAEPMKGHEQVWLVRDTISDAHYEPCRFGAPRGRSFRSCSNLSGTFSKRPVFRSMESFRRREEHSQGCQEGVPRSAASTLQPSLREELG